MRDIGTRLSRISLLSSLRVWMSKRGGESSLSDPYTNDSCITTADWLAFLLASDWSVIT